jgi:hypothetical protein
VVVADQAAAAGADLVAAVDVDQADLVAAVDVDADQADLVAAVDVDPDADQADLVAAVDVDLAVQVENDVVDDLVVRMKTQVSSNAS